MKNPGHTIAVVKNKAYLRDTHADYEKPEMVTVYHPLADVLSSAADELPASYDYGGVVRFSYPHSFKPFTVMLLNGGRTLPIAEMTEREPIPAPKTRLQTRWYEGRWQKATKTGWRDA